MIMSMMMMATAAVVVMMMMMMMMIVMMVMMIMIMMIMVMMSPSLSNTLQTPPSYRLVLSEFVFDACHANDVAVCCGCSHSEVCDRDRGGSVRRSGYVVWILHELPSPMGRLADCELDANPKALTILNELSSSLICWASIGVRRLQVAMSPLRSYSVLDQTS